MVMFTTVVNANEKINAIRYIEGNWSVVTRFFEDGKWGTPLTGARAIAQKALGEAFIRMNFRVAFPGATFQYEMTLSYDQFNKVYRLAFLDDVNGYMDVYSGQMTDGLLTVFNTNTGTAFPDGEGGICLWQA